MLTCPNGHPNPADWEFCGEYGSPILEAADSSTSQAWYQAPWVIEATCAMPVKCSRP